MLPRFARYKRRSGLEGPEEEELGEGPSHSRKKAKTPSPREMPQQSVQSGGGTSTGNVAAQEEDEEDAQRKPDKISAECGVCGEILQGYYQELNDHFCSEAKCQFCEYKLKNFFDFVQHYKEKHPNCNLFQCPYCGKFLDQLKKRHTTNVHLKENCPRGDCYRCKKCEGTILFKLHKDKREHDSQYHFNGYMCFLCRKILKEFSDYITHGMDSHGNPFIFKCVYCGKIFNPSSGSEILEQHVKNHASEKSEQLKKGETPKTYQCSECQKEYVFEEFLINHGVQKHGTACVFKCSVCIMKFTTSDDRESHEKEKHHGALRRRAKGDRDKDKGPDSKKPKK